MWPCTVLVLVLLGLGLALPTDGHATEVRLQNEFTKRCLADVNGAEVVDWVVPQVDCSQADRRQRWQMLWAGVCEAAWCQGREMWRFRNTATGRCIAIKSTENNNGQPAVPAICVPEWIDQNWIPANGLLVNYVTGRCLIVFGAQNHVGQPATQFDCVAEYADQRWRLVPVEEPPPPPPSPPAADPCRVPKRAAGARLEVSFRRGRRQITTRYGERPRVLGRLVGADRRPIGSASVCVTTSTAKPTTVVTDREGRFAYKLPVGASRRVWFVYRRDPAAVAASVAVRVRPATVLRLSRRSLRNGQTVRLRGRLRPRPVPGVLVVLQARDGRKWDTFATTRVQHDGRFRFAYRFTRTFEDRTYILRARVPAQLGYPFAASASRGQTVRVRG